VLHVHAAAMRGADALNRKVNVDFSGLLKLQRRLEMFALLETVFEAHEHYMVGAGLELDRLAGLDLEPVGHRTHLDNAVVHLRGMNLEAF
jgi:hypothetical protein